MITQIQIASIDYEADDSVKKYVEKKIGKLDRYLPRHARKSATAEVRLKQIDHKHGNKYQVEAKLIVPNKIIQAQDATGNMLAAVDIVERKLHAQLREYKQIVAPHVGGRRAMMKIGKKLLGRK